jgi:hypothetical protein
LLILARQTRIIHKLRAAPRPALGTLSSSFALLELSLLLDCLDSCSWTSRAVAWFTDDFRFEDGDEIPLILCGI